MVSPLIKLMKLLEETCLETAIFIGRIRLRLLARNLTTDQWANRLGEFVFEKVCYERYWELIELGLGGQEAFNIIVKSHP